MSDLTAVVATYRVVIFVADELDAAVVAEVIREHIEADLDPEDGDFVSLTQVIPFGPHVGVTPTEMCDKLRVARNVLIRTRIKECFDLARELDKMIFVLSNRRDDVNDLAGYDWSSMLNIAADVLKGKFPID